jgi:phosphoglycolate phosphatase
MEGKSSVRVRDYSAYIFDLDGTLFTIPVDWSGVRKELAAELGEPIGDSPLFSKLKEAINSRPSLKPRLFSIIESYELRAVESAKQEEGASELLYSLFEAAKLALVTMQGRRVTDDILRAHKLADLFEVVVTREDSIDRAEQLQLAMKRLGAKPAEVLFTGDRLNDVISAKRAGVDVALVGRPRTEDPKPNYYFPNLAELKAYLE